MILFVAQNDFMGKDNNGGITITKRNYKMLSDIYGGKKIDIAMIAPSNKSDGFQNNKDVLWIEGNKRGISNVINEVLNHTYVTGKGEKQLYKIIKERKYDIIWLDSTHYGSLAKKIKKYFNIKVITYAYDFESEYMKMYCNPKLLHPNYYLKMHRVKQNERDALLCSDKFLCISDRDRESYVKKYNHDVDLVLPVTFSDIYDEKKIIINEKPFLLFVGSYFMPNIEGITWFGINVAPKIDIDVKVVGKGMEKIDSSKFPNNIKIIGAVNDLSIYYKSALAVIMPIFAGSGMKVKTAEAMMYGKTIIASNEALIGYSVENILDIYRSNTVKEFVNVILEVKIKNSYFSESVRSYYLEKCETNKFTQQLRDMLNRLLEEIDES